MGNQFLETFRIALMVGVLQTLALPIGMERDMRRDSDLGRFEREVECGEAAAISAVRVPFFWGIDDHQLGFSELRAWRVSCHCG